jgi:ornithine cyclodeaminase
MGALRVRVIDGAAVRRLLPYDVCIEAVDAAMRRVSAGSSLMPLRQGMSLPDGTGMLGMMPGYIDEPPCFGVKLVSLFPGNRDRGFSTHSGVYILYETHTGQPVALLNAAEITAIRTAAASAVATRALARTDAAVLGLLGTGEQAIAHLRALPRVRQFRAVRIWGRAVTRAAALADFARAETSMEVTTHAYIEEVLEGADVVCTVTGAAEPVLAGAAVRDGTHLCVVGSSVATRREVDDVCVARARFFVDYRPSAMAQAGELLHAIRSGAVTEAHVLGEIGDVLVGRVEGRRTPQDITLYKSLGVAAQDLAAATVVLRAAEATGMGTLVTI